MLGPKHSSGSYDGQYLDYAIMPEMVLLCWNPPEMMALFMAILQHCMGCKICKTPTPFVSPGLSSMPPALNHQEPSEDQGVIETTPAPTGANTFWLCICGKGKPQAFTRTMKHLGLFENGLYHIPQKGTWMMGHQIWGLSDLSVGIPLSNRRWMISKSQAQGENSGLADWPAFPVLVFLYLCPSVSFSGIWWIIVMNTDE